MTERYADAFTAEDFHFTFTADARQGELTGEMSTWHVWQLRLLIQRGERSDEIAQMIARPEVEPPSAAQYVYTLFATAAMSEGVENFADWQAEQRGGDSRNNTREGYETSTAMRDHLRDIFGDKYTALLTWVMDRK